MTHKEFFFKVLDLLDENKIKYWLMCGTLLGAVRDKDFLPGDTSDTDIAIQAEDQWKLRKILNKEHLKKKILQYNYLRRGEITVSDLEWKYKVDIFLMEKKDKNYYIYSYRPNPKTKKWDYEWRAIFPYNLFFPLKTTKFLGRKVYIPNKYKEILEIHYGKDWKIPNPNWVSNKPLNKDKKYQGFYPAGFSPKDIKIEDKTYDFAYICINILRKEQTKQCIISLKKQYPNCKIYMGDQDSPSVEMYRFYEKNDVEYYFLPWDCGLSYARNFLVDKVKEPYIMWGDNDFIFDKKANIYKGIELLKAKKDIGVVGGLVLRNNIETHYERILMYDKTYGILVYIPLELTNPKEYKFKEQKYYYCDLTFNYAIAKKEVFDNKKIRWNENVKVAYEHSDFFLKLKLYSKYKTVYFPTMKINHVHILTNEPEYRKLRSRIEDNVRFAKYWDLKMNFTIGKGKEVYSKERPIANRNELKKLIKPKNIIETKKLNINLPTIYLTKNIEAKKLIEGLSDNLISFIVLKETCLDSIRYRELIIKPKELHLSTKDREDYHRLYSFLLIQGFKTSEKLFSNKFNVILYSPENIRTKNAILYDKTVEVPFPVVSYLEEQFGHNWMKKGEK